MDEGSQGWRSKEECSRSARCAFMRRGDKAGIAGRGRLGGLECWARVFDLDS